MKKSEWKLVKNQFIKDLNRDLPVRDEILVGVYFRKWVEAQGWSEKRKKALVKGFKWVDGRCLTTRDLDGELHVIKHVVRLHSWGKEEIEQFIREESKRLWGIECTIPVEFVQRDWKTKLGGFVHTQITEENEETYVRAEECRFRFSEKVSQRKELEDVKETIRHELVHWYCFVHAMPAEDTDKAFVLELYRIGVRPSSVKSAQKAYETYTGDVYKR